jgi:hypothetical protein
VAYFFCNEELAVLSNVFLKMLRGHATIFPAWWYLLSDLYGWDSDPSNCSNLYYKLLNWSKLTVSFSPQATFSSFSNMTVMLPGEAIQPGTVRSTTFLPSKITFFSL